MRITKPAYIVTFFAIVLIIGVNALSLEKKHHDQIQGPHEKLKITRENSQISEAEALAQAKDQAEKMGVDFIEIPDFQRENHTSGGVFTRKCFETLKIANEKIETSQNKILLNLWRNMRSNDTISCQFRDDGYFLFIDTGLSEFDIALIYSEKDESLKIGYILSTERYTK